MNIICKEILDEVVGNMDRAIVARAMDELVNQILEQAQEARNVNILVKEVEGHGQQIRDKVEQRLKSRRLE